MVYRTLGMIIVEKATRILIFFIFGYVRNFYQKRMVVNGYNSRIGWGLSHNSMIQWNMMVGLETGQ